MSRITATPTPRLLHAIRHRDWSVWAALSELIDNSFGEQRGNASNIWIGWNPKDRVLFVLDDGRGMDDVGDLFVLGKGSASGQGDIGLYGVGGSEAGLWLSDRQLVQTLRNGQVASVRVDWAKCVSRQEYPTFSTDWRPVTARNWKHPVQHGTLIILGVRDGLRIVPDDIQAHLSRTFAAALRHGRRIFWLQDVGETTETTLALEPWNPGTLEDVVECTIVVQPGLSATIKAGRVDGLSIRNSKLSVNYLYRQIKAINFEPVVQGACGYIDLSPNWLEHLTTTKDNFRESSRDLEAELLARVWDALQPLIEKLEQAKLEKIFTNVKFKLQTRLHAGIANIRRARSGYGPGANPVPRPPGSDVPPEQPEAAAIVEIEKCSDASMEGLLCRVELAHAGAKAFVNQELPLIKQALKTEPVNQLLLESYLIQALASELVKRGALVSFGLFTEHEAKQLVERFNGESFDVVLYLIRTLTDGIVKEEVNAA
jgi:hypothetical protein